jgi:Big-like domain-containing protein
MTSVHRAVRAGGLALASFACVLSSAAQPPAARRATNIEAILAFPDYFHGRSVILVGTVATQDNGELRLSDNTASVRLVHKGTASEGLSEIRGEFFDLGRIKPDDPRVTTLDVKNTFHIDPESGTWPRPGEVTAVLVNTIAPTSRPDAPSLRAIVLFPGRYLDQKVTIVGQYAGRNLFGDLPDAPGRSQWDFELRSSDAAIWVTNIRPKGKDFDLALDRRIDTGRWLQVSGLVQQRRGLQWIQADAGSLVTAKAPTETTESASEPVVRVPAAPPPEVIFSAPTEDESDVAMATTVRIQLSRDIDPASLKGNVHVSYQRIETLERGEPVTPTAEFTATWNQINRMLELKFTKPLERFRTVKVELTDAIKGTDGQPLKPWTLTFATGGT